MRLHFLHDYTEIVERWASPDTDNIIFCRTVVRCSRCGKEHFRGGRFLDWDAQNVAYRMRQTTHPDLPPRDPFSSEDFMDALMAYDNPPTYVFAVR